MRTLVCLCFAFAFSAQAVAQTCSEEAAAAVDACVTACHEAAPECERQPLTLDEIRAALDEKCDCETARNYGKYRSCVAKLINSLRAFALVDPADLATLKTDSKTCRDTIKARRKGKKGNKGNKGGKGKNDSADE